VMFARVPLGRYENF